MLARIVCAAIRVGGRIYTGRRHGVIMRNIWKDRPEQCIGQNRQGFLDSDGNFVSRKQAGIIAYRNGQTSMLRDNLMSEDLW